MKTSSNILAPLVALSAFSFGLVLSGGGCAATPTQESTGEYVDDSAITLRVKAAFVNDPLVKALDVKVETFKGIVQLSGFVNTNAEKAQAGRLAAATKGVTEVKNNITVK
ncbi:MAG: BON domain-containing protein [Opitutaceae bacterium]|nr:BON domain-containing protein [Opitutaceae bacterium]